jgi:uncharacterized SAM-dependent methyltransferase
MTEGLAEKPEINDLIFKELLKRGYSLEGNTRIWNIADSKLWYLAPEQAQAFLDLEGHGKYKEDITEKEIGLIKDNTSQITKILNGDSVNIIDIGCGDGSKAKLFIEALQGKVNFRYCPIDISSYMVEKAIDNLKSLNEGEVVDFHWNISDFENLENISSLLRHGKFKKNLILLLGNTLGNFEINELLYEIRSSMKDGDLLIIGNGLNNEHPEEIISSYNNELFNKFSLGPILGLGLEEEDVKFGVRFKNGRVESYYTLLKDKFVSFLDKKVEFNKGDQIIVVVSYKYTEEDFRSFMNMYFDGVDVFVSKDKSYVLCLARK